MINALRYWKIINGTLYKKYVYNYKFPTLVKLPIKNYNYPNISNCIKQANVGDSIYWNEAQNLINNLGDLRIK